MFDAQAYVQQVRCPIWGFHAHEWIIINNETENDCCLSFQVIANAREKHAIQVGIQLQHKKN